MTETSWSVYLEAVDAIKLRLVRLAGDQAAESARMRDLAKLSTRGVVSCAAVERHCDETDRIARELAQALEVIDRIKPDESADTGVLDLAAVADEPE